MVYFITRMAPSRSEVTEEMKRNGAAKNGARRHQIMTLREVAGYLGLHVMTVYKLTREGRVPAAKIGGQWRFKRDVLDDWLEAQIRKHTVAKA